jgi:hypothetical protein
MQGQMAGANAGREGEATYDEVRKTCLLSKAYARQKITKQWADENNLDWSQVDRVTVGLLPASSWPRCSEELARSPTAMDISPTPLPTRSCVADPDLGPAVAKGLATKKPR